MRLALGVRGTVAGHRLGALEGGRPPAFQCIPRGGGGAHTGGGLQGLGVRPCAALVPIPAPSGPKAKWTGAAPMALTSAEVRGGDAVDGPGGRGRSKAIPAGPHTTAAPTADAEGGPDMRDWA